MPYKDPQKKKEHDRLYAINNRERIRLYKKAYFSVEENRIKHKKWCRDRWEKTREERKTQEFKDRENANQRRCRSNNRRLCIGHYSDGKFKCACCGEGVYEFLTIDHVGGGGNKHRRTIKYNDGTYIYLWLKRNGYPPGFAVLCMNCNWATRHGDPCPHSRLITPEVRTK